MGKIVVALMVFSFILTSCSVGSLMGAWNEIVAKTNANYLDYSTEAVKNTNWDKVLFFHATWCGSCKSASKKIAEAKTSTWLTVFKVDYDSNTELRKMYDVTSQHTFVQVDRDGKMLAKWSGSKNIEGIESNLVESMEKEEMMSEKENMVSESMEDKSDMMKDKIDKEVNANYMEYKDGILASTSWDKVLFFHAEWCGTCVNASKSFTENTTTQGLTVFKVDFDTATELRKKYDVTDKHTFVEVDSDGNKISMWRWSNNIFDIKTKLNQEIAIVEEKEMIKKSGMFIEYSAEKVAATSGNKVLFFHANWCPSCITAAKNLSADSIPEGLNVFKVDYDSSADLKVKYGVVSQHTFVQIDDNGTMVKRWFGSRNYWDILSELQ